MASASLYRTLTLPGATGGRLGSRHPQHLFGREAGRRSASASSGASVRAQQQPDQKPATPALWYIREYALDQRQPISQHSGFLRADWVDAFVPDLELTALTNLDLQDRSGLVQVTADYYLSRVWTIGGLASFSFGTRHSDFGSLPQAGGVLLRLVRHL